VRDGRRGAGRGGGGPVRIHAQSAHTTTHTTLPPLPPADVLAGAGWAPSRTAVCTSSRDPSRCATHSPSSVQVPTPRRSCLWVPTLTPTRRISEGGCLRHRAPWQPPVECRPHDARFLTLSRAPRAISCHPPRAFESPTSRAPAPQRRHAAVGFPTPSRQGQGARTLPQCECRWAGSGEGGRGRLPTLTPPPTLAPTRRISEGGCLRHRAPWQPPVECRPHHARFLTLSRALRAISCHPPRAFESPTCHAPTPQGRHAAVGFPNPPSGPGSAHTGR
jgi:hypothetical protein